MGCAETHPPTAGRLKVFGFSVFRFIWCSLQDIPHPRNCRHLCSKPWKNARKSFQPLEKSTLAEAARTRYFPNLGTKSSNHWKGDQMNWKPNWVQRVGLLVYLITIWDILVEMMQECSETLMVVWGIPLILVHITLIVMLFVLSPLPNKKPQSDERAIDNPSGEYPSG